MFEEVKRNIQIENQILIHMVQQKRPVLRLNRLIKEIFTIFTRDFNIVSNLK